MDEEIPDSCRVVAWRPPVTLAAAAARFDRTVPHLVRSFKREYGITPYAYVVGARIEQARKRPLHGEPPAQVAVALGFHDQAHFTRHFKRHVSVPPAQYATSAACSDRREGLGP